MQSDLRQGGFAKLKVGNGENRRPALQRKESVASDRFLAAALHDLGSRSAAVQGCRQPTLSCHSKRRGRPPKT